MQNRFFLACRFLLAGLVLGPAAAFAQDAPTLPAPSAPAVGLSAPPPERHWVLSAGPFNPISGLIPNLRVERVVRPHLSVALEGAFRRDNYATSTYLDRVTASSLSAGVRYYFAATAPKGFYVEALVGGQYHHFRFGDQTRNILFVRPEVGAGYQFLIGKRRRFVADLGVRFYSQHLVYPKLPVDRRRDFLVYFIPSVRIGFAF